MAMMDLINRVYKTLPQGARAQLLLCDAVFLLYTFSEHLKREDPMGLVTGKEILAAAHHGGYAVGAFNINNLEILQGVVAGCVEMQSPLIIAVSEGALHYAGFAYIVAMGATIRSSINAYAGGLPR
jgi:hypothetical protein